MLEPRGSACRRARAGLALGGLWESAWFLKLARNTVVTGTRMAGHAGLSQTWEVGVPAQRHPPLTSVNQCTHIHARTHARIQSLGLCGLYRKRKVLRTLTFISVSTNRHRELSLLLCLPWTATLLVFLPRTCLLVPEKTKEEKGEGTLIKSGQHSVFLLLVSMCKATLSSVRHTRGN